MRGGPTLTVSHGEGEALLVPRPFLFRLLDCQRPLGGAHRYLLDGLREVAIGRGEDPASWDGAGSLRIEVPDPYVSTTHAQLTRAAAGGRWRIEDRSKNGTFVNGEKIAEATLGDGDVIEMAGTFFLFRDALPARADEDPDLASSELRPPARGLETLVPSLAHTFGQLERVARSPLSIVLRGETGTGKEVLASAIHALSGRRGAFVAVNCGALPVSLVESELFGFKKGAFSGAVEDRAGLIRSADGGTLFLDEIGDLPLLSQASLLRVLQEREVLPLGATRAVRVDVRVVAASHHELRALVAEKRFRADLEARLEGIELEVPPLRERREDLGILIASILRRVLPDLAGEVVLDRAAVRALLRHDWPKNIRELEQALSAAVVLAGRLPVGLQHLPAALRRPIVPAAVPVPVAVDDAEPELRRALVLQLEAEGGNISAVARAMGKPRKQIQRWLKRLALDPAAYRRAR